jgi:hypothetical protein
MQKLSFELPNHRTVFFQVERAYSLGNTGRTKEFVNQHISELEDQGIPIPSNTDPSISPLTCNLITQDDHMQVLGDNTTGEVEFAVLINEEGFFITLGSDHADRILESKSSPYFKQVCQKPVAHNAWPLSEVIEHWDSIQLLCEVKINNEWIIYQEGNASLLLEIEKMKDLLNHHHAIHPAGTIVFCGTMLLKKGKFEYAKEYRMTMHDPVLNRSIKLNYLIETISDLTI